MVIHKELLVIYAFKIEENEKIIKILLNIFIIFNILYFNQLNQSGQVLKILTPSQMLTRLPISLAQLNAGNNSQKRKTQKRN